MEPDATDSEKPTVIHRILILTWRVDEPLVRSVTEEIGEWVRRVTGDALQLVYDFKNCDSTAFLVESSATSDAGKPALIVYPDQIETIGKTTEMKNKVDYDSVCLFYDPTQLNPRPTASASSRVSYYGFSILSVMASPTGDRPTLASLFAHELLHGFYRLIQARGAVELPDAVHRHSYFDPRPEANYSAILDGMRPYWRHLGTMAQNKPETLIVHHTKVSRDKNPRQFDAVDRYHRDQWNGQTKSSLGFYGGYHYLIEPDGTVGRYRNDNEVGAHCKEQSMNFRSLGICLTGDFDVETPTVAQQNALRTLLREKMAQYSITRENIVPHRFYASYKSCFGANLPDDWARRLVAEPNDTMKWVIDSQKNQWLISDSPVKIAVSIPDETALKELLANGLQGTPEAVANLDGYVLYRGASEQSWRAFLNL